MRIQARGRVVGRVAAGMLALAGAAWSNEGENRRPVAEIRITPGSIPSDDAHGTIVTLDSRGSWDPDGDALSVRWVVRGARFVDGTDQRSRVARITLQGGRAWPVQLTVTDAGNPPLERRRTAAIDVAGAPGDVHGEPVAWHPLEIWFHGPSHHETDDAPNPFLDYRMTVTFRGPGGAEWVVPGFFDGDGAGGGHGDVWKARFAADAGGIWHYRASFRAGDNVALGTSPTSGTKTSFDGAQGFVLVNGRDELADGFLSKGRLEHSGGHYLEFRDGGHFLKGGTDSPENFFAYEGFDDVFDAGGLGIVHQYAGHRQDWSEGDPHFVSATSGVDSKGIVGALNYLGEQGVNSLYFLPMNLGGDGQDTYPFVGHQPTSFAKRHYDISRLHQWNQVLEHAQRRGILVQLVLAETETANENWLDVGELGVERKLFYREMVARFGHVLGLKWNLSEENDYSVERLRSFAAYIDYWDAYQHPIAVHTKPNDFSDYDQILGDPLFRATSIQYAPDLAGEHIEAWREASATSGCPWVLDMDENNPWDEGLTDVNADDLRKRILWDVYLSGGGLEWYFGHHPLPLGDDQTCEDFRTREAMWGFMRTAREFVEEHLPFWEMQPADHLLAGESTVHGGGEVFAEPGQVYAVYLPRAQPTGSIDLAGASATFRARWFNPRNGAFEGTETEITGGGARALGAPPSSATEDWVWLLEKGD